eukprot:GFUD01025063.1.p1 GENE.GFUD01025063.1~~GFUD01025063.1.p1  ORF type:complete len:377 (-),score=34.87 GFUD01025063.1:69-1199(-)
MSIFDACTIQAFDVLNGKTNDVPPQNTEKLVNLSKAEIIKSIIDPIIEDVVAGDSLNNKNTNGSEHQDHMDSQKTVDNFESIIVKDPTENPISEAQTDNSLPTDKIVVKHRLKKKVKRLSRKQLEVYITEKAQELIKAQTEVGKLQTTCQGLKKEIKEWKDKSDNLAKSCSNLAKLVKLNIEGNESKPKPKKQVRSVGIQVKITTLQTGIKRSLDEKEESCSKKQVTNQHQVTKQLQVIKQQQVTKQQQVPSILKPLPSLPLPPLPQSVDTQSGSVPKPNLKLTQTQAGLEVYWTYNSGLSHTLISSYELYAHQDTFKPIAASTWKKVGDIKSIPLPIRCTLSHFKSGSTYYFVVRAKDLTGKFGQFSDVQKICLK